MLPKILLPGPARYSESVGRDPPQSPCPVQVSTQDIRRGYGKSMKPVLILLQELVPLFLLPAINQEQAFDRRRNKPRGEGRS